MKQKTRDPHIAPYFMFHISCYLIHFPFRLIFSCYTSLMPLNNIIRLSVSEAARLFGVSQRTVRRAITDGEITYVVVQGRYKINFESLLRWSQSTTTVRNKRDRQGLGQYVDKWKIRNRLYSPNPQVLKEGAQEGTLPPNLKS